MSNVNITRQKFRYEPHVVMLENFPLPQITWISMKIDLHIWIRFILKNQHWFPFLSIPYMYIWKNVQYSVIAKSILVLSTRPFIKWVPGDSINTNWYCDWFGNFGPLMTLQIDILIDLVILGPMWLYRSILWLIW